MHSGITKEVRNKTLTDFKNDEFNVLLTSKVLDEGYNLPKIDVAIITASDSTSRQTVQRMGRVLRKKEKNSNLYQLYCKETMEEQQALKRTAFFKDLSSRYNYYFYGINDNKMW
jgi:superfamily II DNA or RNA helicase